MAEKKTANTPELKNEQPAEKKVTIRIPITKEEKDDVYVSVNNRSWLIKRGVEVEVPECVVEVLRHKEEQEERSIVYEESLRQD